MSPASLFQDTTPSLAPTQVKPGWMEKTQARRAAVSGLSQTESIPRTRWHPWQALKASRGQPCPGGERPNMVGKGCSPDEEGSWCSHQPAVRCLRGPERRRAASSRRALGQRRGPQLVLHTRDAHARRCSRHTCVRLPDSTPAGHMADEGPGRLAAHPEAPHLVHQGSQRRGDEHLMDSVSRVPHGCPARLQTPQTSSMQTAPPPSTVPRGSWR